MTTSPSLKYSSKGWKDNSYRSSDMNKKETQKQDKNWQRYSSVLEADQAEILKKKLPEKSKQKGIKHMSEINKSKQSLKNKDVDHKKPVDTSGSSFELNLSDVNAFVQHRNELAEQKQSRLRGED